MILSFWFAFLFHDVFPTGRPTESSRIAKALCNVYGLTMLDAIVLSYRNRPPGPHGARFIQHIILDSDAIMPLEVACGFSTRYRL